MATRVVGVILVSRHGQFILLCSSRQGVELRHKAKVRTNNTVIGVDIEQRQKKSGVSDICTKQSTHLTWPARRRGIPSYRIFTRPKHGPLGRRFAHD